jgi:hypothetical protein
MESIRKPTHEELQILSQLINKAGIRVSSNWKQDLLVRPLTDGNMGSLRLITGTEPIEKQSFGSQSADLEFLDADNVTVIATLNLDKKGELFELDIWKTDYSPLISYPIS